jgi:hypothetical protein
MFKYGLYAAKYIPVTTNAERNENGGSILQCQHSSAPRGSMDIGADGQRHMKRSDEKKAGFEILKRAQDHLFLEYKTMGKMRAIRPVKERKSSRRRALIKNLETAQLLCVSERIKDVK